MRTECSERSFNFQPLVTRQVTARFDGGTITSDAGGLLLREVEAKTGLLAHLARCFDDFRDPELIEHSVEELLKQRVFAGSGYEDLNDHDTAGRSAAGNLVGKRDVTGQERGPTLPDRGQPLAGRGPHGRDLRPRAATAGLVHLDGQGHRGLVRGSVPTAES